MEDGLHHNRRNLKCFYPDFPNCVCGTEAMLLGTLKAEDGYDPTPKSAEVPIYRDDMSMVPIVIERHLSTASLIRMLCVKNRVSNEFNWRIVEHWPTYGFVRVVDNKEDIMLAYRRLMRITDQSGKLFFIADPVIKEDYSQRIEYNLYAMEPTSDSEEEECSQRMNTNTLKVKPAWMKHLGKSNVEEEEIETEINNAPPQTAQSSASNINTFRKWIRGKTQKYVSLLKQRNTRSRSKEGRASTSTSTFAQRQGIVRRRYNTDVEIPMETTYYPRRPLAEQPWYHNNITKQEADRYLKQVRTVSGVFLVRASQLFPGLNILSYKVLNSVVHVNIATQYSVTFNKYIHTVDRGRTFFFEIPQMIDYFKLNLGSVHHRFQGYVLRMDDEEDM